MGRAPQVALGSHSVPFCVKFMVRVVTIEPEDVILNTEEYPDDDADFPDTKTI